MLNVRRSDDKFSVSTTPSWQGITMTWRSFVGKEDSRALIARLRTGNADIYSISHLKSMSCTETNA